MSAALPRVRPIRFANDWASATAVLLGRLRVLVLQRKINDERCCHRIIGRVVCSRYLQILDLRQPLQLVEPSTNVQMLAKLPCPLSVTAISA